jgi:exodeoxyribonuclease VII small subunit
MTAKKAAPSFSKAFEELEEITRWFESEDVDVDEALKRFERGLDLAAQCKKRLSEVENNVKEIKKKYEAV